MNEPKPGDREFLQDLAVTIKSRLPDAFVFFLLAGPSGEGGRTGYVSNMRREDAINVMKEFLIKCSAADDWMKHLK